MYFLLYIAFTSHETLQARSPVAPPLASAKMKRSDLTVSALFSSPTEFVNTHLLARGDDSSGSEDEERLDTRLSRKVRIAREEPSTFPGLRRLCLRGVKSVQPYILPLSSPSYPSPISTFLRRVLRLNCLLHLANHPSNSVHSLARCIRLTGEAIKNFLIQAPATARIQELTLYGD
jgi:hypothetical protein